MQLDGKTALLTGASRGLGVVLARALAERGVHLLLAARSEGDLAGVRGALQGLRGPVETISVDLAQRANLERLVQVARARFGAPDILIHNAALVEPQLTADAIERTLAINLSAPMLLTAQILPDMQARGRGHILSVASVGGLLPMAYAEAYAASKHGLVGFTRALRATLARSGGGVQASLVCPGFIADTGMYADRAASRGIRSPFLVGACTSQQVAQAVLRCLERGPREVIVAGALVRGLCAAYGLAPRLCDWLIHRAGGHTVLEGVAQAEGRR